jgi:hypothetical protein
MPIPGGRHKPEMPPKKNGDSQKQTQREMHKINSKKELRVIAVKKTKPSKPTLTSLRGAFGVGVR